MIQDKVGPNDGVNKCEATKHMVRIKKSAFGIITVEMVVISLLL